MDLPAGSDNIRYKPAFYRFLASPTPLCIITIARKPCIIYFLSTIRFKVIALGTRGFRILCYQVERHEAECKSEEDDKCWNARNQSRFHDLFSPSVFSQWRMASQMPVKANQS